MKILFNPHRVAAFTWWVVFIGIAAMASAPVSDIKTALYWLTAAVVQATILSSPVLLLSMLWRILRGYSVVNAVLAVLTFLLSLATTVFLMANYKLDQLYGFYVNYFVVNLLITPGGVEAMGVSHSTMFSLAIGVMILAGALWLLLSYLPVEKLTLKSLSGGKFLAGFLCLFVAQALWFAWAEYRYQRPVLQISDRIVWHVPVTARTMLEQMGFAAGRPDADGGLPTGRGTVAYPLQQVGDLTVNQPYNIVWLVAESWRADMLDPEIMPETYAFAQNAQWFKQHYSGGNGTRMGMFSQFYGLYGSYWFDILGQAQTPLLLDTLQASDYDLMAYTSSRFSYPEFDKTIFAGFADSQLQSYTEGDGWQRDRKNVTDLLSHITSAKSPFFTFMFFESAHANYYFPEESIIEPNYLEDFNYLTVDVEEDIELIRARYINANHHLDSQMARVFQALEKSGRLNDTIVIVTGDHGEEFMEKGRWGHNSTFSQEQIRVPLLIHAPGRPPAMYAGMTSHLDLPATVMNLLGIEADPSIHSYGGDMLSPDFNRTYTVASDWHGNALITPELKMIFSKKSAANSASTTSLDDEPMSLAEAGTGYRSVLERFTRELSRFYNLQRRP